MKSRISVLMIVAALALAGCGRSVRESRTEAPAARYVAEAGLTDERIAALRAAPPGLAEFAPGKQFDADEDRLGARGFVRVGVGYYPGPAGEEVPREARDQAAALGADQALVYVPEAADGETRVAFFVRMTLAFGATFRDLNEVELRAVGGNGVQLGSIVGGSPASRANLLAGDIVLKVDETNVVGKKEFQQLLRSRGGRRVTLLVWRDGRTESRMVRLGAAAAQK